MTEWSLSQIFAGLHGSIERRLEAVRKTLQHQHSCTKGNPSENTWLQLFQTSLPQHYTAVKDPIVDGHDQFSDQIHIVVFDRQNSLFIYEGQTVSPLKASTRCSRRSRQSVPARLSTLGTRWRVCAGCTGPSAHSPRRGNLCGQTAHSHIRGMLTRGG